jgi:aubergine-like protein
MILLKGFSRVYLLERPCISSIFNFSGYVTAIDHYEGGLLLQCDISHRVLRTETVRDALTTLKKRGGDLKTEAEKALLGVSILTR